MKVILLQDIAKVGKKYDVKEFSDGYAQNVLISKGLALRASPQEIAKLEERKKALNKRQQEEDKQFHEAVSLLASSNIVLKIKSNEKGNLFRSVQKDEIQKVIKDISRQNIDEENIVFPKPIKELGTHLVRIKKGDLTGEFYIRIE